MAGHPQRGSHARPSVASLDTSDPSHSAEHSPLIYPTGTFRSDGLPKRTGGYFRCRGGIHSAAGMQLRGDRRASRDAGFAAAVGCWWIVGGTACPPPRAGPGASGAQIGQRRRAFGLLRGHVGHPRVKLEAASRTTSGHRWESLRPSTGDTVGRRRGDNPRLQLGSSSASQGPRRGIYAADSMLPPRAPSTETCGTRSGRHPSLFPASIPTLVAPAADSGDVARGEGRQACRRGAMQSGVSPGGSTHRGACLDEGRERAQWNPPGGSAGPPCACGSKARSGSGRFRAGRAVRSPIHSAACVFSPRCRRACGRLQGGYPASAVTLLVRLPCPRGYPAFARDPALVTRPSPLPRPGLP